MENYERVKIIGCGSFGSVYLVKNKESEKYYAMKQVKLDDRKKYQNYESVVNESRILSQLKHPNIVEYYDSFFDSNAGILYIVQDFCDGGTLDEKIKSHFAIKKFIDEILVMKWFVQILMAIQYIHSMKILHRDIKPQNVFLNKNENVCKLGDFGIAKSMSSTVDVSQTCIGTPYYMSPEMCEDIPYSSKADIWALGCLLHEMCSQHPAFESTNLLGIITKIINTKFDPLPAIYSQEVTNTVCQMLKKNPEDRPSACQILQKPYIKTCLENFILRVQPNQDEKKKSSERQFSDDTEVVYEDDFESDCSSDENYEEDFEDYVSDKELDDVVNEAIKVQKSSWSQVDDSTIFDDEIPKIKDLLKPYRRMIDGDEIETVYLIEDLK